MPTRSYRIDPFLNLACRTLDVSPARVFARAGLSTDFVGKGDRGLTAQDWFAVLEALLAEGKGAAGAIDLGRAMAAGPLHPALVAFSASPDIMTGIRRLATFKPLIAPVALRVGPEDGCLAVDIRAADDGQALSPPVAMMEIAYFLELFRIFAAEEIVPLRITLASGDGPVAELARLARCDVVQEAVNRIMLPEAAGKVAIVSADTEVYRAIEREMSARLRALETGDALAERVGREIRHLLPSGRISVEVVADRLRISTRSLQRKLQQEGVSFQEVLDRTRASLAMIYLRDHKLSTEETSYLLAYRDPNSFYRAFNDWTGMTPAEARATG